MTKRKREPEQTWPQVFEGFGDPTYYARKVLHQREPSCGNGVVDIYRFRVTVERIEDPVEVLKARLLKLWRETDNHHHWTPLKAAAAKLGYELPRDEMGVERKKAGAP